MYLEALCRKRLLMQTYNQKQYVPISLNRAWDFFSDPRNLKKITPTSLGFQILNDSLPERIYPGMIIKYKVRPLLNIPMTWVTEITQAQAPDFFIDNQKSGPYTFWHHQHFFREVEGGVEIIDIVNYKVPLGILGRMIEKLVVNHKVRHIFNYRSEVLKKEFGF